MKYNIEEIGFILYNNRSNRNITKFIDPNIDLIKLIEIEKKFNWSKSLYEDIERTVNININELNIESDDIEILPEQLSNLDKLFKSNIGKFSENELDFLSKRKIKIEMATKYKFLGLSNFKNEKELEIIGATTHPLLKGILPDGIEDGGIVQPLFVNNIIKNCSIRRISDVGKLKYTIAIPDISVWGLDEIDLDEEIWICEGILDMIALQEMNINAISVSSAMWSTIQLYQLINKKPKNIVIFADNDRVGIKTASILNNFFNLMMIPNIVIISEVAKDAFEHFNERGMDFTKISPIKITKDMILSMEDNSFNFLEYLKNRKF